MYSLKKQSWYVNDDKNQHFSIFYCFFLNYPSPLWPGCRVGQMDYLAGFSEGSLHQAAEEMENMWFLHLYDLLQAEKHGV